VVSRAEATTRGCDALIRFNNAADAVLTFFQRFPGLGERRRRNY
jgi:hypothetical protein